MYDWHNRIARYGGFYKIGFNVKGYSVAINFYKMMMFCCLGMSMPVLCMEKPEIALVQDYRALGVTYVNLYKELLHGIVHKDADIWKNIFYGKMTDFANRFMKPLVDDLCLREIDPDRYEIAFRNLRILHTSILHELELIDIEKLIADNAYELGDVLRAMQSGFVDRFKNYLKITGFSVVSEIRN